MDVFLFLESITRRILNGELFLLFTILIVISVIFVFSVLLVNGIIRPLFFYYPVGKNAIYSPSIADKSKKHIAIIAIDYPGWMIYRIWKNTFIYSSGVEILKKGLEEIGIPFIIYHPSTRENFMSIIKTIEANPVWIIGHGYSIKSHKGLSFEGGKIPYNDFPDLKKFFNKDYVMQLQCWGSKKLCDCLCEDPSKSYYTEDRTRDFYENRNFIINTLEKMRKGEF